MSAVTGSELRARTGRLDASIRLAGYVPQRLDGAQDAAFAAATIPLGVGPANRRTGR